MNIEYSKEELMTDMMRLIRTLSERVSFENSGRKDFDKTFYALQDKIDNINEGPEVDDI